MSRVNLYKTVLGKVARVIIIKDAKLGDKFAAYESPDSGFLSGENLTISEDLSGYRSEPPKHPEPQSPQQQQQHHPERKEDEEMRLDSGIVSGLSESFSDLNLKNPSLNDLGYKSKTEQTPVEPAKPQPKGEFSWTECFKQDEDGDTPLHVAIVQGFVEIALALIRMAPRPFLLDTPNDDAQTPIHLAVATRQPQIVRWLVAAGAKPSPRNINGDAPLHIAARNGYLDSCIAITEPVQPPEREALALSYPQQTKHQLNLDQWNYEGQTCVHVAAINGHLDVLSYLVQKGADINAREGRGGYTALHYAIEMGNAHLATSLLRDCTSLNWNALTYGGLSALQLGCSVPANIADMLKQRNVPYQYNMSSSSEDESESDSDMLPSPPSTSFAGNLVNASA